MPSDEPSLLPSESCAAFNNNQGCCNALLKCSYYNSGQGSCDVLPDCSAENKNSCEKYDKCVSNGVNGKGFACSVNTGPITNICNT